MRPWPCFWYLRRLAGVAVFVSSVAFGVPQPAQNISLAGLVAADSTPLLPKRTKVVKTEMLTTGVVIELSKEAVDRPWRPEDIRLLEDGLRRAASIAMTSQVVVRVGGRPLEDYVAPFFRSERKPRCGPSKAPPRSAAPLREMVRPRGAPVPLQGLAGRHIVVWPSHGLYYDKASGRWMWQRPRMFTTVEDRLTMSVVNDYLIPMLERAGATVISCRERDAQIHEIIVDDGDGTRGANGTFETSGFAPSEAPGFANGKAPYAENVNPHALGTTQVSDGRELTAFARWTPRIPADGDYAVYVSYSAAPQRSSRAHYRVRYWGGVCDVLINQQMAGNMWVYLGTFHFRAGQSATDGSVELLREGSASGSLSADAVKFGGGIGNVMREGRSSGYPRYLEAARYWFQYTGADPALVYAFGKHAGNDYTEDYVGRPEFANYLVGAPRGPNADRNAPGKGVPVDLAFALHTDASVSTGTVGTLAIYRLEDESKSEFFPDGRDRMLNRDLADLVQTQLVDDIRAQFCSTWNRRELADRDYAEARRPNVPCVLIEALSHQNYDDIKFALDPTFREVWARAIYKGMLRFLATEYGYDAVVAPLPPRLIAARVEGRQVRLEWEPTPDPFEPTATPAGYIVYRKIGHSGLDSGTYVGNSTSAILPLSSSNPGTVESFCVSAVNAGGESSLSDVYSVCVGSGRRALVVHGFDRISPPALAASQGPNPDSLGGTSFEGVNRALDRGVADRWNSPLVGDQFDFDRAHAWLRDDSPYTNDHPGHGASFGDLETTCELGRTPDLALRHAEVLAALGFGVETISANDCPKLPTAAAAQRYEVIDLLLGEQRTTLPPPPHDPQGAVADRMGPRFEVWPVALRQWVRELTAQRVTMIASGAYVASDPVVGALASGETKSFVRDVLRCKWTAERATTRNDVRTLSSSLQVHVSLGVGEDGVYGVESPGGIAPAHKSGKLVLRYVDTGVGAGIVDQVNQARIAVVAFPLECVVGFDARRAIFEELLR
ncbi:MAG: N-acetylmuramoyl-L-alanine amidase [Candidatus Sumerlaeaceae bacterium]